MEKREETRICDWESDSAFGSISAQALVATLYGALLRFARRVTAGNVWSVKITVVAVCLSVLCQFPSYDVFWTGDYSDSWRPVLEKFANPAMDMALVYGTSSHAAKLTWRLVVPLVAHYLGLGVAGALSLQFVGGLLLFYLTGRITHEITEDRIISLLVTLGVASISAGSTSFTELRGNFDGIALALIAASMFFKKPLIVGMLLTLAYWTDERALVVSPLIFLYHWVRWMGERDRTHPHCLALGVVLTWIFYGATRAILTWKLGWENSTGGVGLSLFLNQVNLLPFGIWTGLEGGWWLVLLATLVLFRSRSWALLSAYGFSMFLIVSLSNSVVDITRSMAYILPALFVALSILARTESLENFRLHVAVAFVISLAWPGYGAGGRSTIWWQYPLPIQLLRWLLGRTG